MLEREVYALLKGASDAALAVTPDGRIRCCNSAAERLIGRTAHEITASYCMHLFQGEDDQAHPICALQCAVRARVLAGQPVDAFDCFIVTSAGRRWVNVSIITLPTREGSVLILHLLRDVDSKKKLESLTRQMLDQIPGVSSNTVDALIGSHSPHIDLTPRERSVHKLLADGLSTKDIARQLGISLTTVRNHINHILQRLAAHSRTEAVLRAVREHWI